MSSTLLGCCVCLFTHGNWNWCLCSLEMCKSLEATIKAYKIDTCWQWKPLLNGKEVMSILGMTQGGPSLGIAMDACFDYQLVHPDATTEDLKEFLTTHSADILSQKYIF